MLACILFSHFWGSSIKGRGLSKGLDSVDLVEPRTILLLTAVRSRVAPPSDYN